VIAPGGPEIDVGSPLLALAAIRKRFGGVVALDGVDFELRPGEVHGVVGENGAGKSTLMKLLAGVYADYQGEMRLGGEVCRFSSPADAQSHGIAMVYQELSTFPHLSVAENIFGRNLPTWYGLVRWRAMTEVAQRHLHELGLDIDVATTMGHLPLGRQQLVEIARVVFSGARALILDEPTSALSPPETERLFDFIRALKTQGRTLIFISHFLDDVLAISDRITVLKNGRRVATLAGKQATKQQLVELMIGHEVSDRAAVQVASDAPPRGAPDEPASDVLRVEGLSKRGAFSDVSFSLRKGDILGCFAFMGAGQTQLGRCLFGAERADRGTLRLDGRALRLTDTVRARAAGIAFVPEDRRFALMMSKEIFKNVTVAHLARLVPWWVRETSEIAIAAAQMKSVGVRPANPRLAVGALSGGNQQKVVLAKWLTQTPRVLVLNEPTRGMDVGAKEEVLGVIRRMRDEGVAILVISTEPETVLSLASRALVMRKGRITAELSGRDLNKENLIKNA
jgi:ribose transport system ATP-binding protein